LNIADLSNLLYPIKNRKMVSGSVE